MPICDSLPLPNALVYHFARLAFKLTGWHVEGELPDTPRYVIVSTHTSNWDFAFGILGMAILSCGFQSIHIVWLGKQELFRGVMGAIFRRIGGIPIDRQHGHGVVEQAIAFLRSRPKLAMLITPQGTRKRRNYWKTGFYHIALGAGVPILLGYIDYRRRAAGPGPLIVPSGDIEADMAIIRDFYQSVTPRYPWQAGDIRVRQKPDMERNDGE